MEIITHRRHAVNIAPAERFLSVIGGGIFAAAATKQRWPFCIGLALLGAELLRRGISGHSYFYEAVGVRTAPKGQGAATTSVPYELGVRVDETITIQRPREQIFRFWRNYQNLPRFLCHVESVTLVDDNRSHWVVKGPGGRTMEWDAVIHNEVENERIAWRSLPGGDVDHAGTVLFKDALGGRGTELRLELQYNPPGGAVGAAAAALLGQEASQQIREDLRRLKRLLESGEWQPMEEQAVSRAGGMSGSDGQRDWEVDVASEGSFPASDPPGYY
jgi:uncharacterized membrane protein